MKKRIIAILLVITIFTCNMYFSVENVSAFDVSSILRLYSEFATHSLGLNVDSNGNYVPINGYVNPDQYGLYKTWSELNAEQKAYRVRDISELFNNALFKVLLYRVKATYKYMSGDSTGGVSLYALAESYKDEILAAARPWGAETAPEALIRMAGLGNLIDSDQYRPSSDLIKGTSKSDVDKAVNATVVSISPELANWFQKTIDESIANNSDIVNCLVLDYRDYHAYGPNSLSFDSLSGGEKGRIINKQNFVYSKLKYNWPVWFTVMSFKADGSNTPNNEWCFCWVESPMSDFVYYLTQDPYKFVDGTKTGIFALRRKDNQPFTVKYTALDNDGSCTRGINTVEKTIVNSIQSAEYSIINGQGMYWGYGGLFYQGRTFGFYRSAGHMSSAMNYGPTIPDYLQSSDALRNFIDSLDISAGEVNNYDYTTIINNIGDTTGMNAEELQKRIDEVMGELGAISGNTEDISHNTELQVSVLHKILDKLDDIYDKIGSGGGGGVLTDLLDTLASSIETGVIATELAAIEATLAAIEGTILAWFGFEVADEAGDKIETAIDIGTDIGNEIITKFPFCLPWDIMAILSALKSVPEVPVFEVPFKIPSWGIDTTFTLDLTDFQKLSDVSKWFFDVLYGIAITKLTLKLLQVEVVASG